MINLQVIAAKVSDLIESQRLQSESVMVVNGQKLALATADNYLLANESNVIWF